jgi:flagellar basal body-associated protein FliL
VRLCQCIPLYIGQLGLLILILIYIVNATNAIEFILYFFSHGVIFRPKKKQNKKQKKAMEYLNSIVKIMLRFEE